MSAGVPPPAVLEREMGCTRADLARWLPGATRGAPARWEGDRVTVAVAGGRVELSVAEAPPRRLGGISLPVLEVRFRFVGVERADRERFMAHFDDYTRRGGG